MNNLQHSEHESISEKSELSFEYSVEPRDSPKEWDLMPELLSEKDDSILNNVSDLVKLQLTVT